MRENPPKAVVFDLDGTLYLGDRMIDGADRAVGRLRRAGIRVCFLTNKPLYSERTYSEKLTAAGIDARPADVITSVRLTRDYLIDHAPEARLFVIGERHLRDTLVEAGFALAATPDETDIVVVSLDRGMDYAKMHFAYRAGRAGARIVATNPDLICPVDGGEIVDAGAWIAALEGLLARPIDEVIGKPSHRCVEMALKALDVDAADAIVVGDRMETDIRMARKAGLRSALVLSGVTGREDLARFDFAPDYVWESVGEMPEALGLS